MSTTTPAAISKPMLFSGPMVLRLLDGSKTQTRRVILKNPEHNERYEFRGWRHDPDRAAFDLKKPRKGLPLLMPSFGVKCPHPVGSLVWVKETYGVHRAWDHLAIENIGPGFVGWRTDESGCPISLIARWKSPRFMPRKFSRITLEITGVKVERLQSISFEDCRAEGCSSDWKCAAPECREPECRGVHYGEKWHYMHVWDSINGKTHPWASSPWVWVYEFRRIKP